MTIIAAADGSALGNPGPAGWAWYVDSGCWAAGGWPHGTNNLGELMAVLDLLQQTAHRRDDLHILCDSMYVINSITKWMPGWKRKGWKKGDGKPVLNVELMKAIDQAMAGREVRFEWVKGHAGHALNEEADRLANGAAAAWRDGHPPDPGPGFTGAYTAHPDLHSAPSGPGQILAQPDLFAELEDDVAADDLGPTDIERVIALERSLLTDPVRGDAAEVAALLHSDWQEIGASGRLWAREEMLAEIGPVGPVTMEVVSTSQLNPDTILLVWRSASDSGTRLRSSLWVRADGGWRQIFHQGTPES